MWYLELPIFSVVMNTLSSFHAIGAHRCCLAGERCEAVILSMVEKRLDKAALARLPWGVALPLLECLHACCYRSVWYMRMRWFRLPRKCVVSVIHVHASGSVAKETSCRVLCHFFVVNVHASVSAMDGLVLSTYS